MPRRISGQLVIATHNPGKLAEMRELLSPYGVTAISASELGLAEPEETGDSFAANAKIKAVAAATAAKLPAFADDSGLAVDALDGAPGIYSARWAGPSKDFNAAMSQIERLLAASAARPSLPNARPTSSPRFASPGPTATSRKSRRGSTARWSGRRAARPASATIRCFSPTATTAPSARCPESKNTACRRSARGSLTGLAPSSNSRSAAYEQHRSSEPPP